MHARPSAIATIARSCILLMLLGTAWAGNEEEPPAPAPDAAPETEVSRDSEFVIWVDKCLWEMRCPELGTVLCYQEQYSGPEALLSLFELLDRQVQEWWVHSESSPEGHQVWFFPKGLNVPRGMSPPGDDLQRMDEFRCTVHRLQKTAESFRRLALIILIFVASVHFILLLYFIYKMPGKKRQEDSASQTEAGASQQPDEEDETPLTAVLPAPRPLPDSTPQKPEEPNVHPPADRCPAELVPLPSPPAENWKDFCGKPLPKELGTPFPGFRKAPQEGASPDSAEIPLAEARESVADMLPRRWEEYRSPGVQESIARRFIAWAAKQPDGRSLLLRADADCCYWFVGDIHGGFGALRRILTFICRSVRADDMRKRHTLILLGDYIDRGSEDFAVLAIVEELLMASASGAFPPPFSVIALRGNHDTGLSLKDGGSFGCSFDSTVKPAETADALNAMIRDGQADVARSLGKAAMELARISPCMGELTNLSPTNPEATLLFTHGGLPHTDLQREAYEKLPASGIRGELTSALPAEFRAAWEEDFTWIRLVEKAPIKIPNRGSHGCDMGTNDVNTYRRLHQRLTGRAITFIIRGHDHEQGGYRLYSYDPQENDTARNGVQRNCGVLTINALDITELEKSAETGHPCAGNAVVACWSRGQDIALYRLPMGSR